MKINVIPTLITLMASCLLAYLFYTLSDAEEQMLNTLAVSGFISTGICLECGIGVSYKDSCHKVNLIAVSSVFLTIFIIEHCCFAIWSTSKPCLVITTGLLLVLYLLCIYKIVNIKM